MPKQNVAVELFYSGIWNDIAAAADVFADTPITITRGQGDESAALRPAQISMSLANDDDRYRTSNPVSPLYGLAGRNTPTRVKVGGTVRGVAEASSWSPDQTQDFRRSPARGKAWVDLEAGGLLQRIGQWTQPLRSPMTRQASSYASLIGLWPLEDGRDSTILTQISPGVPYGTFSGEVTLGDEEHPGGAQSAVKIGAGAVLQGTFKASSNSGWQISCAAKMPALPPDATYYEIFSFADSLGRTWSWQANNTFWHVFVTDASGAILSESFSTYGTIGPDDWVMYRVKVKSTQFEYAWYTELEPVVTGATHVYAAATGTLRSWRVTQNALNLNGWYSAVFGVDDSSLDLITTASATGSFNGYVGETAGDRFARLMTELGLSYTIVGTSAKSMPMGAQPAATFSELLKEIVTTEDALLFDSIDAVALTLLLRNARYRQTPALTITPTDLPVLPKEVTDDLNVHNVVTASQRNGGDSTAEDSTSALGSQAPPSGVGEYRQTVNVNLYDDTQLPQVANWWLRRGTVDLPRFPQLTIDLGAKPYLITAVESVEVGDVITITGFREYTIRLYVLGWTETIGTHTRTITFTCAPDQQLQVGAWDSTSSLWDSATHFLKTTVNTTATALTFRSLSSKVTWSTTTPYDVLIAGEQVTVTSMGAASLVGGGYDQAATVTRSVNGVVKSLAANSTIHVATPGRWAL
jgi:hypothetical protein